MILIFLFIAAIGYFVYSGNRVLGFDQQSRRRFTLTLRYKFNAAKSKYKGTGAGQEQRSRM